MIGFFLFVVVGSSVLQIVQMAGMGGRIAQQMENQQPRAEPQPRPRKKKPTPAAGPLISDRDRVTRYEERRARYGGRRGFLPRSARRRAASHLLGRVEGLRLF